MNKFILCGRVGKVIIAEGEKAKATFTLCVDNGYTDRNTNEWVDRDHWFFVQTYNPKQVEIVQKHIQKGDLLNVEGELEPWSSGSGSDKKSGMNLALSNFKRLHRPKSDAASDAA
ncbi:hypothetical protein WH95_19510 [Kiloniella litopenaei]|uniref:Single-stranded DNA-binding protein n=1 Tax=Kiloniella litopenaei TaxID=1549748 RepID=A0A0M2R463_9PROT|nr:single-stranded DNA-binding protein [Kiloniella litopenaei]KKJ75209.1 hypothetical protein WH95_19510 [Kiloniella litopenaei]